MAHCRGMRMGYAPLLALLEPARDKGFKRLAIIGIPCQVYALRAMEQQLGFERLYVIGTPCSDNTTTERFHQFLALLAEDPDTITYLEFRADYHVELRFADGRTREIPFLQLPISKLPPDFFPLTCRTCVDYTNVLADITVGYMGGQGEQWLLVRNDRGEELLATAGRRDPHRRAWQRRQAPRRGHRLHEEHRTRRRRPAAAAACRNWLRPVVGWLMPRIGPRGLEFARARVEMKAVETVIHLRRSSPEAPAQHGARSHLGTGQTLWPDPGSRMMPAMILLLDPRPDRRRRRLALHPRQAPRRAGGEICRPAIGICSGRRAAPACPRHRTAQTAPAVILLHGLGSSLHTWEPWAQVAFRPLPGHPLRPAGLWPDRPRPDRRLHRRQGRRRAGGPDGRAVGQARLAGRQLHGRQARLAVRRRRIPTGSTNWC